MAKTLILLALPVLLHSVSATLAKDIPLHSVKQSNNSNCSTWMYFSNKIGNCICGSVDHQTILCNNRTHGVSVLEGYLVTYDEANGILELGQSLYGWRRKEFVKGRKKWYYLVNSNRLELNRSCTRFNRYGRLCGRCKDNYSPLIYSYDLRCVANCTSQRFNIAKFVGAAFIPLTFFYLFVVFFKFNANSPALQAFILGAQLIGAPAVCRYTISQYGNTKSYALLSFFLGIWSLDFFRFGWAICLNTSSLTALSLDYAVAFYPLFLIFLTYTATRLHSRGCKVITLAWSPFKRFIMSKWDSKSSLIDVMATFMLLSYTKVLSVSFDLLNFTRPMTINGSITGKYLYNDPTIKYFGPEHRPYAILAIVITLILNVSPLLLLLFYPMRCFQKLLNRFKLSSVPLHTFVESILGYYKDGTEPGDRDCRYFGSAFFLIRLLYYIDLTFTKNLSFLIIFNSTCTIFVIFFLVFKPYKEKYSFYNTATPVMFLIGMALVDIYLGISISEIIFDQRLTLIVIGSVFAIIPFAYIAALVVWWTWKHNPMKLYYFKYRLWRQERSVTTTMLFNAAESRSQGYGAI